MLLVLGFVMVAPVRGGLALVENSLIAEEAAIRMPVASPPHAHNHTEAHQQQQRDAEEAEEHGPPDLGEAEGACLREGAALVEPAMRVVEAIDTLC